MKFFVVLIIVILTIILLKEKWDKMQIVEPYYVATESFHMQWIAISILWFIAGVFFTVAYMISINESSSQSNTNLFLAIMYFYIAIIYVIRGLSKDIISRSCLWTSKGKLLWCDVTSFRVIEEDNDRETFIYIEIVSKQKIILMKYLKEERVPIEALIEKVWC